MKIALSTVAALLVALAGTNVEATKSIPHSLAKAAFTTTKQTRSLRNKEQMRLRKLASQVRPQSPPKRRLEDGADAGYSQYQWSDYNGNYDLNEDMTTNEAFGFDISSYSFHYTGCSAIKAYNDDVAADESTETVLRTNRMATFRLCPTDTCSSNSFDGCNSNYGEYVVSMDDFLLAMVQLQEDRVVSYCEYCEDCAGVESFKNFYSEFQYKHEQILQTSENSYSSFAESYTANLQSSGQYSDDTDFDLLAQKAYYQKLSRGNYANNYVYGNSYNNNYYGQSGNGGYNYQNQEQKYSAYSDNGNGNGNANYYQSYGGDGNSNYYQSNGDGDGGGYINGKYYDADTYETMVEQQEEQTSKNQALWKKWYSFSTSSSSNNGGKDEEAQSYGQFYNSMSTWSSMGAWYGHQIVNGYTSYDDYGNEEFVAEWGFIGYDNAFHSLEDDGALKEWDEDAYGFGLPEGWKEYMNKADELESCAYDSSSSCYNQFFSCMQVLNADEYQEFIEEYNSAYYETMYEEAEEAKERASLTDYLQCTAVDYDGDIETDDNNNNNNNENANEEGYNWAAANGNYNSNSNSNSNSAAKYASYQNDDGSYNFYVGPHCDGDTISLGVYVDEYCSQYASGVDVTDVLGYDPMEGSSLNIVPNECVSCQYDELTEKWYADEEVDEDGVEPMCSMLYQFSGKCNKNLDSSTSYSNAYAYNANGGEVDEASLAMYQSEQQYLNEDAVCSYIDSLRFNTYDEDGEVILDPSTSWNPSSWKKEIYIQSNVMNPGLKAGLIVTGLAAFSMAMAALVLHGMLARKNIPWRPKDETSVEDPVAVARQSSGILVGRARSGPGTAPLI